MKEMDAKDSGKREMGGMTTGVKGTMASALKAT